jgi:hypothetical protein
MNVKLLGALFVSLLLPIESPGSYGVITTPGDGDDGVISSFGSGYWGDFELAPVFLGQDYTINFSYCGVSSDSHAFSLFWQNKLTVGNNFIASFKEGEKEVSYYDVYSAKEWVHHESYLSYNGTIKGSFTIPATLISSSNQLFLLDYQTKENKNYIASGTLITSSPVSEERVDLASASIAGPISYSFLGGNFKKHTRNLSLSPLKDNYLAKGDVVPLSSLILSSTKTSNQNSESYLPNDKNLVLNIKGHDLSEFPYSLSGFETISLPLKFLKGESIGEYYLALKDGGSLLYPRTGDYSLSIENKDEECFGCYGFSFSLERENPYFGSCQNADWCVGVE